MELLIVIAIIGILAAIAIPQYQEYVRKARRSDAKAALTAEAQRAERFYTENSTYVGFTLSNVYSPDAFYTVGVCDGAGAAFTLTVNAYSVCATPRASQTGDSCGVMSLNQQGIRTPSTAGCW